MLKSTSPASADNDCAPYPLTCTKGDGDACAYTVLYTVTATPSASNAGPQFAIVAGTRTLTIARTQNAERRAQTICGQAGPAVRRVLHSGFCILRSAFCVLH